MKTRGSSQLKWIHDDTVKGGSCGPIIVQHDRTQYGDIVKTYYSPLRSSAAAAAAATSSFLADFQHAHHTGASVIGNDPSFTYEMAQSLLKRAVAKAVARMAAGSAALKAEYLHRSNNGGELPGGGGGVGRDQTRLIRIGFRPVPHLSTFADSSCHSVLWTNYSPNRSSCPMRSHVPDMICGVAFRICICLDRNSGQR